MQKLPNFSAMSATKISLKLLIDKNGRRVLFAEAGKDFVDFLFSLLALPFGSVVGLLANESAAGSIGNLYKGIEDLEEAYLQIDKKDILLRHIAPTTSTTSFPILLPTYTDPNPPVKKIYNCLKNHRYVSRDLNAICIHCGSLMNQEVQLQESKNVEGSSALHGKGFVQGLVTYMVTDDLMVMPMSMISGIAVFSKCNVKEFDALEEKMVEFGVDEGLKLLRASLHSKAALTQVFPVQPELKNIQVAEI